MTLETGIFLFVTVVTLCVTGGIVLLMLRNPRAGLKRLDHHEDALPEVMTGRYLTFFCLAVMAVAYGDFLVMAGLQAAYIVASMADVVIYARKGRKVGPHLMAAFASAVAAGFCLYVVAIQ